MVGWLRKLWRRAACADPPLPKTPVVERHTIEYAPGDVVVVTHSDILSPKHRDRIRSQLKPAVAHLADDSTRPCVVILEEGMTIKVIHRIKRDGAEIVPFDIEDGTVEYPPPEPEGSDHV